MTWVHNTGRKVGRWTLPVMPTYLLLRVDQWKKKGRQKKWQEQTILANAVCNSQTEGAESSDTTIPTDNFHVCLPLSSLWHCPGLAHENLGNESTSCCCPDSHLQQSCTDIKACRLHSTAKWDCQLLVPTLQHTAIVQGLHLVLLIHSTSKPNTSLPQELLAANNINCDRWTFTSINSFAES